jgi:primosomal protein N' (replication factor Y)
VSGRAGRKEAGKVLIQTMQPQHPVLQFVLRHDYKSMYEQEVESRKQFFYPPFSRIIHLTFKHKMKEIVDRGANEFANALRNKYGNYLVGPAEPVISRIRNLYLMELLVKLPRDAKLIAQCKKDILNQVAVIHNHKSFKSLVIVPDVDAV